MPKSVLQLDIATEPIPADILYLLQGTGVDRDRQVSVQDLFSIAGPYIDMPEKETIADVKPLLWNKYSYMQGRLDNPMTGGKTGQWITLRYLAESFGATNLIYFTGTESSKNADPDDGTDGWRGRVVVIVSAAHDDATNVLTVTNSVGAYGNDAVLINLASTPKTIIYNGTTYVAIRPNHTVTIHHRDTGIKAGLTWTFPAYAYAQKALASNITVDPDGSTNNIALTNIPYETSKLWRVTVGVELYGTDISYGFDIHNGSTALKTMPADAPDAIRLMRTGSGPLVQEHTFILEDLVTTTLAVRFRNTVLDSANYIKASGTYLRVEALYGIVGNQSSTWS